METTKILGLEYLWIDSLCIVQDDSDDWQRECTQMAEVYRYGYCNIAALEATNSYGGCFRQRDPVYITPIRVESRWDGQDHRLWVCGAFQSLSLIHHEIDNSPLQHRAWVLQERYMAPRILHFGQKAIFWECRTVTGCQSGNLFQNPFFIRYSASDAARLSKARAPYILSEIWSRIVTYYTKAALTFKSDRFIAISAVAREVQRILSSGTNSKVEYLAGLWTYLLEYQLMWGSTSPDTATRISEVDQLTAPSWSWASLNGPVDLGFWNCDFHVAIARVLRHSIVPRSGDPFFGPEAHSKSVLEISGLLWRLADPTRNEQHTISPDPPITISLGWDTKSPLPYIGMANFLLPVVFDRSGLDPQVYRYKGGVYIGGLILQKVDDLISRSFRRIGVFDIIIRSLTLYLDKAWRAKLDKCIALVLENNIIWPSQYSNQPLRSTPAHKVWAKATAYQTIFLE
jgi:hypothetical protein